MSSSVLAVIYVAFDPLLRLGDIEVRWQTIGATAGLVVALAVATLMTGGLKHVGSRWRPRWAGRRLFDPRGEPAVPVLRLEDLVLVVAGSVPGAVIGGRLVHGLVFWDAYATDPWRLLDPSLGSLSLMGALLGGLASGGYVARTLGTPVRRWADAVGVPLLLAIGLGKLAQFLGGSGQGLPFDGPWGVAFLGAGPWVSNTPEIPSHASQVYEGIWTLIGIPLVLLWAGPRRVPRRVPRLLCWADRAAEEGRLFVGVVAWFLLGRAVVGFTWRDEPIVGGINVEQALALAFLLLLLLATTLARLRARRRVVAPRPLA